MSENTFPVFEGPVCPVPRTTDVEQIVIGHGSGGRMTHELILEIFAPAFASPEVGLEQRFGNGRLT